MANARRSTDMTDVSSIGRSGSINSSIAVQNNVTFRNRELRSDLIKYRLKYLFGQPCSVFCKSVLARMLSGRQVYLILVMILLEQIAYSTASDYLIYPFITKTIKVDDRYKVLVRSFVMYIIADLLFPVMGFIADVWVGQYRMVHASLWTMWLGYACMVMMYSVCGYFDHRIYALLPFFFIIISFGHAGFQSCIIPYGANLIAYRTSQELSSYFYFYYWVRNLGLLSYVLSTTCNEVGETISAVVCLLIAVLCVSLVLILNGCCRHHFMVDKERANPYKKVLQVLYLMAVIKRPVHRSAFSFNGAQPPSRINLTKKVHGGKFTNEEVEDVKTFLRLLLVLAFIFILLTVYTGVIEAMPLQLHDMNSTTIKLNTTIGVLGQCGFSDQLVLLVNVVLVLTFIPFLNSLLYPFLREYMPNMVKRMGLGSILATVAQLSLLIISGIGSLRKFTGSHSQCAFSWNYTSDTSVELGTDGAGYAYTDGGGYVYSPVSEYYMLIPLVFVTVAEVFINITSLEFFYAQSPHQMRGMMIGLTFFAWGLGTALSQAFITTFGFIKTTSHMLCDFWYYMFYTILVVVGTVGYIVVAKAYKNRQRGERSRESDLFYRQQYTKYYTNSESLN